MDVAPPPHVTYSAIAQKLDHAQSLLDIRDLVFEPTPPLRQVAVHITVLPIETNIAERRWEDDIDETKDQRARSGKAACAARNDYKRTMKRAFGMPRGFFSPSWMISGGVFEEDIL
jgi:hypothetical protein